MRHRWRALLPLLLAAACAGPSLPGPGRDLAPEVDAARRLLDQERYGEALTRAGRALEGVRDHEDRARLYLVRAEAQLALRRASGAVADFKLARGAAGRARDAALEREVLVAWGDAEMALGRPADAAKRFAEAWETGDVPLREADDLCYRAHVALREAGDPRADTWTSRVRMPSAWRLSMVERELGVRRATIAATPAPSGLLPAVHRRAEWRARPVRSNVSPMSPVTTITVHHSAMRSSARSVAEAAAEIRGIQRTHQDDRGWADIGYHYLIDATGGVWEGRPVTLQGAHASRDRITGENFNVGNVGVCLLGNFEEHGVPPVQGAALLRVLAALRARYGVPVVGVRTHHEFGAPTACPGRALQTVVDRYRRGDGAFLTASRQ